MEEKTKRRIEVDISGIKMSLVTDESESFVDNVVGRMNEAMDTLLGGPTRRSQLDAAMLCAIGFCSDKITAEKRVRNLEAQISLYDANLRRVREENAELKKQLGGKGSDEGEEKKTAEPVPGEQISIGVEQEKKEEKKAPAEEKGTDGSKAAKLKQIESLLRNKK